MYSLIGKRNNAKVSTTTTTTTAGGSIGSTATANHNSVSRFKSIDEDHETATGLNGSFHFVKKHSGIGNNRHSSSNNNNNNSNDLDLTETTRDESQTTIGGGGVDFPDAFVDSFVSLPNDDDISTLDGNEEIEEFDGDNSDDLGSTKHGFSASVSGYNSVGTCNMSVANKSTKTNATTATAIPTTKASTTAARLLARSRMPRAARAWSSVRSFGRSSSSLSSQQAQQVHQRRQHQLQRSNSQRSNSSACSTTSTSKIMMMRKALPQRQRTFDTTKTTDSNVTSSGTVAGAAGWQEERLELIEKIEALETKLKTKEAVLQSMMMTNTSTGNINQDGDITTTTMSTTPSYMTDENQLATIVVKDQEIAHLEAKVKEQAIHIEQLESHQGYSEEEEQQKIQEQAELLFEEFQQQEQEDEPSLWERIQEQSEEIARLEADREYQRQEQQRERKELEEIIRKLQREKAERDQQEEQKQIKTNNTNSNNNNNIIKKELDTLKESNDAMKQENEELKKTITQIQQEAYDHKEAAQSLYQVVTKLENDKEEEIHLLNIVMNELAALNE